jgi:hypothetical protein
MPIYIPGRLLRSNGRWSLTHAWEQGADSLATKCGAVYEPEEVYDGPDVEEVFVTEAPGEPSFLRCGECFPDGTGKLVEAG